jgi:LPPG:FO 2-phospho-L-lactate transferase
VKIAALAGGVGAARLLSGLVAVMPQEDLTVIVNTGDDFRWHGLLVCPDIDTIIYTLAGIANPETGWGVEGDTFRCLERLSTLGLDPWFRIGDRDVATHIHRTNLLAGGLTLTSVTEAIRKQNGIRASILPMTDSPVPTIVDTDEGTLEFQDYFVRRRCAPRVQGIRFKDIRGALPAPGVKEALADADAIIICPSNPFISIGPILAVPGIEEAIEDSPATVAAVSPVIGGKAVKGPTAVMLSQLGHEVSPVGVAKIYSGLLDLFLVDEGDAAFAPGISAMGIETHASRILMDTPSASESLARTLLGLIA